MPIEIKCCGKILRTRTDVIKHHGTRKLEPRDKREQFCYCVDHVGRYHSNCWKCKEAAYINKIDRSLHKKGLTLNQYLGD